MFIIPERIVRLFSDKDKHAGIRIDDRFIILGHEQSEWEHGLMSEIFVVCERSSLIGGEWAAFAFWIGEGPIGGFFDKLVIEFFAILFDGFRIGRDKPEIIFLQIA